MSTPTIFTVLLDGTVTPTPIATDAPRIARCVLYVDEFYDGQKRRIDAVPAQGGRIVVREVDEDDEALCGPLIYACPSRFNRTEADLAAVTEEWRRACVRLRDEQIAFLSQPMPWERTDA